MQFHDEALPIRSNIDDARDIGDPLILSHGTRNPKALLAMARQPLIHIKR